MFFLNFQNQLQLLILLLFSSYIFMTALSIRLQDPRLKALGLSFFIPLALCIYSFFASPYNFNAAALYLDLSWFLLILALTLISFIPKPSESVKFLYALLFLLPMAAILLQSIILSLNYRLYVLIGTIILAAIELAMVIFCQMSKNRSYRMLHLCIFLVSVGFILMDIMSPLPGFFLSIVGLYLCAFYFYKHTYGRLQIEYKKNTDALERINRNVNVEVIKRVQNIEQTNRRLMEISRTDRMTGLYLKSATLKMLEIMIERAPNAMFSLVMLDIDHFKEINDNLGHQIGDKCIKTLSKLMQISFRKGDILGRYGGDEFVVILPGTSSVRAYQIAERFRQAVQSKSKPGITISIGIATFPEDGKDTASLIAAADKALYTSKQSGRNRVTIYQQGDAMSP